DDRGVGADGDTATWSAAAGAGLVGGETPNVGPGRFAGQHVFVDLDRVDLEAEAELPQERAPARRGRGKAEGQDGPNKNLTRSGGHATITVPQEVERASAATPAAYTRGAERAVRVAMPGPVARRQECRDVATVRVRHGEKRASARRLPDRAFGPGARVRAR